MGRTAKTVTTEKSLPLPMQFLAAWIGMWLGPHQARVIQYQRAENEALRARLGKCRLQLTDRERRRLAKLGQSLGRKALQEVATTLPVRMSFSGPLSRCRSPRTNVVADFAAVYGSARMGAPSLSVL